MGWHIAVDCDVCGKTVTDEDEEGLGTYHTRCYKVVKKTEK